MFRTTRSSGFIAFALLGLLAATAAETKPTPVPATAEATTPTKPAAKNAPIIPVTIAPLPSLPATEKPAADANKPFTLDAVEVSSDRLSAIGKSSLNRDDITRQRTATGDLNKLLQTVNDVQFAGTGGRITGTGILDLRPSLVSIAGGRTYDNNFQIEGLSANSVRDTTNQNIHDSSNVVGHPQTAVINPALVDSLTIYTNDVPAEFGSFTGGVVSAKLRDPRSRFSAELALGRTTSAWTDYLTATENRSAVMPEQPRFERRSGDFVVDLPLVAGIASYFAWSRNTVTLENTQRNVNFGLVDNRSVTVSDNYTAKFLRNFGDRTAVRVTSLWSPYEQKNREQDLKTINNGSTTNKVELTHRTDRATVEVSAAFLTADTSRQTSGDGDLYTYRNFGAGSQVNWVPVTTTLGLRGGLGLLDSTQSDLPLGLKYTLKFEHGGELAAGTGYTYTRARQRQPGNFSAYLNSPIPSAPNPLVISGDGPDDRTVLAGEQALARRLFYPAYDAKVGLQSANAWVQWSDRGKLLGLPWTYRTGLRYDYDDYLDNPVLAPRITGTLTPFHWLTLRAGANRYYSDANVSYSIRAKYPSTITYTRTGRSENGRLVFRAADWVALPASNLRNQYTVAGLKTPYSDEAAAGLIFDLRAFGTLDLGYLDRRNRDEFSRVATYSEVIGGVTVSYFRMTNAGFTNYRSGSFLWNKSWRNHRFQLGGTFSKTSTSTDDYYDVESEITRNQIVYYRAGLVTRSEVSLIRSNFAKPTYINFKWSSQWFSNRLTADVFGRWNSAYNQVISNGTITVAGVRYDRYDDRRAPENIISNLNLSWLAWQTSRGALTLETKITNITNRLPNAESVTTANPYQEGRAIWAGVRYAY